MSELHEGNTQGAVGSSTRALSLVTQAARDGAADARVAADRMLAATSRFTSRLVYTTCYTTSYGFVFPAMLLARAIPRNNEAVRGLIDGANAAIRKVDEIREKSSETAAPALAPA
jgi:N-acetylmuramic acid 6-phosphate (MurNAc-6-P) etherase